MSVAKVWGRAVELGRSTEIPLPQSLLGLGTVAEVRERDRLEAEAQWCFFVTRSVSEGFKPAEKREDLPG